jgi:cell division septation protein DedD
VKAGIDAWQHADYAKAVAIWRPLAEAGDADAAFNLGQAYRLGRGVPLNLGTAQTWLQRAAEKDHLDAQTTLGLLLFGNGNQAEGARWLKQAAEKSDARAMLIFGTALFNGDGVTQDQVLGYAYVSRAAAQGLEPAKSTLEQMNSVMSVEDRKKGLAIAMQKAKTQAKAAPKPPKVAQAAKPAAPKPAAAKSVERSPSAVATSGGWRIQLGAFSQGSSAEALFRKLAGSSPVAGHQMVLVPAGAVTRLQVGPFESKAAASSACASLSAKGQACFPVSGR